MSLLGAMGLDTFFERYWHRRSLVLRGAARPGGPIGPVGPVGWPSLMSLATDEAVESRLVLEDIGDYPWEVVHGPFEEDELTDLPDTGWSLLVHAVDAHVAGPAAMLRQVDFLPAWQLDDVMVSIAPPGGSVGAHINRYDAFLVQSAGQRRWQLETKPRAREAQVFLDGPDLAILASFEPDEEYVLDPGDVLYVPPGVAHFGVAVDRAETWSIGLRTPSAHELVASFVEHVLDALPPDAPYHDPAPRRDGNATQITARNIRDIRSLLDDALKTDETAEWLGRLLTTSTRAPDDNLPQRPEAAPAGLSSTSPDPLRLRAGVRCAYTENPDGTLSLFVLGEKYPIAPAAAEMARNLSNGHTISRSACASRVGSGLDTALTELWSRGLLTH